MTTSTTASEAFAAAFAELDAHAAAAGTPGWLKELRRRGFEHFTARGMPTLKQEGWRFTNLAPLAKQSFRVSPTPPAPEAMATLRPVPMAELDAQRIVVVDSHFASALSDVRGSGPGVTVESLASALRYHAELVGPHLSRYADTAAQPFVALNTAFLADGVVVHIRRGTRAARPVHLVFIATATTEPMALHPRVLIIAEPESQGSVIETYLGPESTRYLTNAVSEVVVGDGAEVEHVRIEMDGRGAFHTGALYAEQGRDSRFASYVVALGGALVRNEVSVLLGREGGECALNGLYVAANDQLIDNATSIDHAQPHSTSRELYKGVLGGTGKGVFNGRVVVRKDAQKTDARQVNKNLLLSKLAQVNTKPQLEILADDVKCSHGATIGRLDAEALFYLRSRAIPEIEARKLLIHAFAREPLTAIRNSALRQSIEELTLNWLGQVSASREAA